ncbi:MAG: apolipoprotein N-acyltransferase [Pseudomonadota bacterium]
MQGFLPRIGAMTETGAAFFDGISNLAGWRRAAAALFAGAIGALAMAPVYALPLLPVSLSVLVLMIDGAVERPHPRRSAFWIGWLWGVGYFLIGVYWMSFSFFVQADQFAALAPLAIFGMPAGLGLFTGAAALSATLCWRPGWPRIFAFAGVFAVFEYLRGHILTGLPWNLVGQSLAGSAVGTQTAAWWGAYGLSLIVIFLCAAPAAGMGAKGERKHGLSGFFVLAAGTALIFGVGAIRLLDVGDEASPSAYVRIVQPNIEQRDKINPDKWGDNFYRALDLSKDRAPADAPLFIIWPENAAPLLNEADAALDVLRRDLPQESVLVSGAVRRERSPSRTDLYFNSVMVLDLRGRETSPAKFYDKHHLVPFGEYMPFYDLIQSIGLSQLTPYGDAGFTPGDGPRTLTVQGSSFAPLICYEAIFPQALYPRGERPEWLLTVTNDAWFGDTSGPRQHLDQARLRSIETGLPMARSANTGVSALIDGKGRILERLKLYSAGKIEAPLPRALPSTLYERAGDWLFCMMTLAFLAAARFGFQPGAREPD